MNLDRCRLYGILDVGYVSPAKLPHFAEQMIAGGVEIIQLRAKNFPLHDISQMARDIHKIARAADVPFIVNDHAEVVRDGHGDGVHVGQDDMPVRQARSVVRQKIVVGKSTHSFEQALAAQSEGADYIGFGPLFATPTKPDYAPIGLQEIGRVHEAIRIPIFCIGGIKLSNLEKVVQAGARRVVIVSELLQSENIEAYAKAARRMLPADES